MRAFWDSTIGKKIVMAVTGLLMIAYLITHVAANLTVFSGPALINRYSAFLHSLGPLLWVARIALIIALVLHIVAAAQLTRRDWAARPLAYVKREPQVSTLAARTIRLSALMIAAFLVFHILHFTTGSLPRAMADGEFVAGDPYHNVIASFRLWWVALLYVIAMAFVGLHLFHGMWSSLRTLGASQPSPQPLHRRVAGLIAVLMWLGFTIIPIIIFARYGR